MNSKNRPNVLVVGDWMIDEDWILAPYRSMTSSGAGRAHYRVLSPDKEGVRSAGGATRTAKILANKCNCNVYGLGIWYNKKEDPKGKEDESFLLTETGAENTKNRLTNLAKFIKPSDRPTIINTPMVIRTYTWSSGEIKIRRRIDWITKAPNHEDQFPVWKIDTVTLKKELEDNKDEFDAIVVHDNGHGVVSNELINCLFDMDTCKKADWFIFSKYWTPERLVVEPPCISLGQELKLLVVPRAATQVVMREGEIDRWLGKDGCATEDSRKKILELSELLVEDGYLLVEADRNNLIMMQNSDQKIFCLEVEPVKGEQATSTATVMFPYLVKEILKGSTPITDEKMEECFAEAYKWIDRDVRRIRKLGSDQKSSPDENANSSSEDESSQNKNVQPRIVSSEGGTLKLVEADWEAALKSCGIIGVGENTINGKKEESHKNADKNKRGENNRPRIELWRSMTEVDGYVCLNPYVRRQIRRLVNEIKYFKWLCENDEDSRRVASCLLLGRPGDGKTFLARQISKMFDMEFLSFNITQMVTKSDIFDCFHTIATTQARADGKPVLVFVDEINGMLDGQHIYDAFLAPLDEGAYIHRDKKFKLDPCAWIFAGTREPGNETLNKGKRKKNEDNSDKGSDFMSRLTLKPPCILNSGMKEVRNGIDAKKIGRQWTKKKRDDLARTENVYLCAAVIRREFPDVAYVTEKALWTFYALRPDTGLREIQQFIRRCENIRYSEVASYHLLPSKDWLKEHANCFDIKDEGISIKNIRSRPARKDKFKEFDMEDWEKMDEGEKIRIV